ncbi:MAG: hypothetical protein A2821_01265 [Candidatus Magasanikbacteria bacterium RIFCSPHIGHO2_01_FULL_41_23]|uniref:DUF3048 domain-containing protein n=1 Tax=Candidatus Magasanikbacteria bacterium RIFCSPLOWO2_01_FULL_40_15 TaxID=1798686 RepID=A0A1F6N5A8_9BACT|nr:MAG: hypothetical protein A2821_01265 [Candidatus Magasanikbacteria bacterium RIFCSPHIGHO2_01_FULL_41_23]OGH66755.1 MAG: hypothetical protein A3C66_01570 [Candidatus Magasanikbacteria bacterium RIFCSPHIGHO2_02_FULL_41_35]OGH74554.1 MAG: hypothetical protein A3F22_02975 [Candidatus Magasanikbacteria bacterium RIFCSPHIGHO2_12_FULL_41_16]OGH78843.1 MAG: hypothetical protein A2983_00725 [Candidatus Magasanikbacteria bacterium RIFCSPLOWO2_01_FULL_40_15]
MKKNKKYQLTKFKSRYWYFIVPVFVLIFYALFFSSSKKIFVAEKKDFKKVKIAENICEQRSRLNGICINFNESGRAFVGVMIENHPVARPQAGLAEASVVYEALVEGNYTRFLAFFDYAEKINKVGPVRSARPYYLDWLNEWGNPLYMHVGGSPEALQKIVAQKIFDANEFYHAKSYWRDSSQSAPHNVYTDSGKWTEFRQSDFLNFSSWNFVTSSTPCLIHCLTHIRISYSSETDVQWDFNTTTTRFVRYHGNTKHVTEEGEIVADTIIIQEIKTKVIDGEGRLALQTIGEGQAVVAYDGKKINATWKKESFKSRTRFFDGTGVEILLKPGKIWLEIVPNFSVIEFTQL